MNDRDRILNRLRATRRPFNALPAVDERRHMVPLDDVSSAALRERFIHEAEKLACQVWSAESDGEAVAKLRDLLGDDKQVLAWETGAIGLTGLAEMLDTSGVSITAPNDPDTRVGITGVDGALAATGSLVLASGVGKPRAVSLLPPVHIAVLRAGQIVADMETWFMENRALVQASSNITVISGPSRTADIALELVMGAHGPRELHVLLLP